MDWQPIETAPKDGGIILIVNATGADDWEGRVVPVVAYWDPEFSYDQAGWSGYRETEQLNPHEPTHWMPLPEPPATN